MREVFGGLSNSMGRKANQRANGENARFAVLFSNRLSLSRFFRTRKYKFQPSAIHVWLRSYATYFRYFRREFRSFMSRLCPDLKILRRFHLQNIPTRFIGRVDIPRACPEYLSGATGQASGTAPSPSSSPMIRIRRLVPKRQVLPRELT